jgi:uncharacterized protein (TIGR00288 family)
MPRDDAPNIAIFCDFENVAIGVREANYDAFDMGLVRQRVLDKGNIVVQKAYADWERYRSAKRPLHEAGFEMIEIPHVRYSGKNSADIRMVVDALDLCYTKEHLHLFVLITGDSDFSPLVGKLRENDKTVIGLGVKKSTSDLLMDMCDEFIYYDDLVRDKKAAAGRKQKRSAESRAAKKAAPPAKDEEPAKDDKKSPGDAKSAGDAGEAYELILDTVEALFRERDDNLWGSMVKQTLKRKRPNFAESYYGFRSFSELLEELQKHGYLELQKDEKSGGYLILGFGPNDLA